MARKFSLDQNALKQFFFLHVEKLIVGLAGVLLLVFLWMGWSTKPYTARTPEELKKLAKDADTYVQKPDSWDLLKEYRKADDSSDVRIKQAAGKVLDADQYETIRLALKEKQAGLRGDPELYQASDYDLMVRAFNATVFIKPLNPNLKLSGLELANAPEAGDEAGGDRGRPEGGAGGGLEGGQDESNAPRKTKIVPFGDVLLPIHKLEIFGLRPNSPVNTMLPAPSTMVEVIGTVPYENQWARYEKVLEGARAYTPSRDRPTHVFLEVQRKMVAEPEDKWVTINKTSDAPSSDPFIGVTSPEVIDPKYYDKALTKPLPPFANFDYRSIATHPNVPLRNMRPAGMFDRGEKKVETFNPNAALFGRDGENEDEKDLEGEQDPQSEIKELMGNSKVAYEAVATAKKALAPYKLIRFFDLAPPQQGEFHYRIRVWFQDPNNPPTSEIAEKGNRGKSAPGVGAAGLEGDGAGGRDSVQGEKYVYVPVDRESLTADVRQRLYDQEKKQFVDSLPDPQLVNARPAAWSDPTPAVSVENLKDKTIARVHPGIISETRMLKIGGSTPAEIPREEVTANVVVSAVLDGLFTYVPFRRDVYRGEYLNFKNDLVHLLHPINLTVLRMKDAEVASNKLVVDIIGGRAINLKEAGAVNIDLNPVEGYEPGPSNTVPGEILLMDATGKFEIKNTISEYGKYRANLFLPDETNEYGKKKEPPREENSGRGDGDRGGGR